jgi:hypothetical protein
VACQFPNIWANENVVQTFLDTLILKYNVDPDCFHLTGLSGGAYSIWNYIQKAGPNFRSPKSIVPFSYSWTASSSDYRYKNIKQWYFCGWNDSYYGNAINWNSYLNTNYNNISRLSFYKLPIGSSATAALSGHCCWNEYYNPTYKENGQNIYEWAMSNCNTVLSLPDTVNNARQILMRKGFYDDYGTRWKFNRTGMVIIFGVDGKRKKVIRVQKGTIIQKEVITDRINFIE